MGLRGPPPKPHALKVLEGTDRLDRRPANIPTPSIGRPKKPSHLKGIGRKAWEHFADELIGLKVLTPKDGTALELLCDAYVEWTEARELVREHGLTYTTTTELGVSIRPRPEVRIAADAWRRMHRMLVEFGLTPAARTRVAMAAPKAKDGEGAKGFLFGNRPS